jgi:hypothetical protein
MTTKNRIRLIRKIGKYIIKEINKGSLKIDLGECCFEHGNSNRDCKHSTCEIMVFGKRVFIMDSLYKKYADGKYIFLVGYFAKSKQHEFECHFTTAGKLIAIK